MNKISKFFLAVAAISMTACSSDEPINNTNPVNPDEAAFSDNYLSVSFMMPTAMGGRAADNSLDNYEDGTEAESKINNVFFFFFDSKDNVIDIQKFEDIETEKPTENKNPWVTSFGTKEIRLKAGLDYSQVAVAINSSVKSASDFRGIKTLSDLENHGHDYLNNLTKPTSDTDKNWGFVMSNSVYYDLVDENGESTNTASYLTDPKDAKKIILVPITAKNIYTSAQRNNIDALIKEGTKAYVDIYVERVLAKVEVSTSLDMDDYYVSDEGEAGKIKTITLYDNVNLTTKTITVKPVILGTVLNVLTPEAKLIKPIIANQVGYGEGAKGSSYSDFKWNDPINKRSYWANTEPFSSEEMTYVSWNEANGKNLTADVNGNVISTYIHPNTQDFEPTAENENNSLNTKVMVVAKLQFTNAEGEEEDLDLVRYGSEYMLADNFLAHVANVVTIAMRSESWNGYTAAEKAILDVLVPNSLADKTITNGDKTEIQRVITSNMFQLSKNSTDANEAYEAKVTTTTEYSYTFAAPKNAADFFKYTDEELKGLKEEEKEAAEARDFIKDPDIAAILLDETKLKDLVAKANETLAGVPNAVLESEEFTKPQLLYWKDGMTYFYTTIKQQGFYGLTGEKGTDDYLNGVVRNHVYKIDLTGFYGLGTPVIDPEQGIDPERPTIERPSYLKARINILPWRIVKNSATIH